jgi:CHAD domain-containing protein
MKRKALEEVIHNHMDDIEKHCQRVPGSFDHDDIHDLRVGYKKIRAFLRLLKLERDAGDIQIPIRLKAVYQTCGKVRDLQLFIPQLKGVAVASALSSFINYYQRKLFTYKELAVQAIEAAPFKKTVNSIKKELPHQLHDDTVQKFMDQKIAAIHIVLLAADHENDLHDIRKHLKDIIYTTRIYENDLDTPFPAAPWIPEKELSDMASRLGDFNDRCLAVSLLQEGYNNGLTEEAKAALNELQKIWLHEKEEQKQQLLQEVQTLQV